jgi:hypothetical protein
MTSRPVLPSPDQISQTLARAHRSCQEMELAGIQLEEVIVQLEHKNLTRRKQQLGKVLQQETN